MAVILTILKVLGTAAVILLAAALAVLLAVLFVPFRYSFSGEVRDPEGSSEPLHLDLKRDVSFAGDVRWLLGALHLSASFDGEPRLSARAFGLRLPLEKLLSGRKKGGEEKEDAPSAPKEKKGFDERLEEVLRRIERLHARIDDALWALGTEYGVRAKRALFTRLAFALERTLPAKWGLAGVLGLGDPARSARVFAVQGFLYPLTAGHVAVGTDYDLYRYDLQGGAEGSVRLWTFVWTGLRLLLDRDVRRLLKRLRRGPAPEKPGHRIPKQA